MQSASPPVHDWDESGVVARFFGADPAFRGKGLIGWGGVMWDTYLLFGPDATWSSRPGPLRNSGSPVDHQIDDLRQALNPLLATP